MRPGLQRQQQEVHRGAGHVAVWRGGVQHRGLGGAPVHGGMANLLYVQDVDLLETTDHGGIVSLL